MIITNGHKELLFTEISLNFNEQRNIQNIFYQKNNKTVHETLKHHRYSRISRFIEQKYKSRLSERLGDFLKSLKETDNSDYLYFLNKYGDESYCHFSIDQYLQEKGLYCFTIDSNIKYIGRCTDSFKKRINYGYGKIYPKNCFIDGQATNCHINALINREKDVKIGIFRMSNSTSQEIKWQEKMILIHNNFEWNIQNR